MKVLPPTKLKEKLLSTRQWIFVLLSVVRNISALKGRTKHYKFKFYA